MGEGVGVYVPLRRSLNTIVANRRRGAKAFLDVATLENSHGRHFIPKHAGKAISL